MAPAQTCSCCSGPLLADAPSGLCPACLMKAGFASTSLATATSADVPPAAPLATPPPPAELAPHFPQFEIIELLGQGGMGMVYKARQTNLDRPVALKILSPAHGAAAEFAQRFEREAKALARLNHPGIVSVYDFGRAGPYYYLSMEFVAGHTLAEVQRTRRLSVAEALAIATKISDALHVAHGEGWVHRDIKPANILIDAKGHAKLGDFGLAKILARAEASPRLTLTGVRMGTPKYMAPEQMDEPESVDHRADLFSLGVVLYEMLTGELPIGRFNAPSRTGGVSRELDPVVYKLLERDPARRYQRAADVATDLAKLAPAASGSARGWTRPRRVAIAATVVLLIAGVAWWRVVDRKVAMPQSASAAGEALRSPPAPGEAPRSPIPNWFLEGRNAAVFTGGIDRENMLQANPSLYLKNTHPAGGTAALVQAIRSDDYRGQRIRFAGQLRSRDVTGRAGLCMRIDYYGVVQSEDVDRRDVEGTANWKECAIVLDVPAGSDRITFGVQLNGRGQVWLNDLKFDVVARDVPTTGRIVNNGLPGAPQFDFAR